MTHKDAIIPQRATHGSAGYDLHTIDRGIIPPSGTMGFDTGIAITPPPQTYGRIASRSGLVAKHNVETKAGVIDADYTGTLRVILHNFGSKPYTVEKGDRIANGAPHLKGSITLANTYAACLEQTGARIFWAIAALTNKIVYGSDASNAFTEAPAPKAPLYLRIDQAYKDWYKARYDIDIPTAQSYVRVKHAIQGHPESPRLWQDFIDKILKDLGFSQITHEPCLYTKLDNKTNERIYLLRQVDDFAVACSDKNIASKLWDDIDRRLSAKLKREGIITRHNGIDITQTASYLKIHCSTYLDKILLPKLHLLKHNARVNKPTPMKADPKYIAELDTSRGPTTQKEHKELENKMGFKYRAATGELIFAMVTCRPDISYAVIKLTQFNNAPTEIHYNAILDIYRYLNATKHDGIQYWRPQKNAELPDAPPTTAEVEQFKIDIPKEHNNMSSTYGCVDSDWAGNITDKKLSFKNPLYIK